MEVRKLRLSKSKIGALQPKNKKYPVRDANHPGLYILVLPSGCKSQGE